MGSSSDTVLAPDLSSEASTSTSTLSSADVVEIRRFAEGKSRIEDFAKTLSSRPEVEPFAEFIRVDECVGRERSQTPSVEKISEAWKDLESKLEQVAEWQEERDSIEGEAEKFEVGDMERLRRVAKAASEREMSPQDTDLIEITMQTLLALDTLLRLLKSRREALDLLQGRLLWEERRKDCWTSYVSLSKDLDDFVKESQWSPRVYQKSKSDSQGAIEADDTGSRSVSLADCSPSTERSTSGATLTSTSVAKRQAAMIKSQSAILSVRCQSFIADVVPMSGKQLDNLIEHRQVPEAFLDEQDRLEDLAENIKSCEVFLIQLTLQWRKADDLFRLLRSLHIESKKLNAAMATAQKELPMQNRLAEFQAQSDRVKRKLEGFCGTEVASTFISSQILSSQPLLFSSQNRMPKPNCKRWEEQEQHSDEVEGILAKELNIAAKYVRQACHSSIKYQKTLQSFAKVQELVSELNTASLSFDHITKRARLGWTEDAVEDAYQQPTLLPSAVSTTSIGGEEKDGRIPNLDDVSCLSSGAHDLYLVNFAKLKPRLGNFENEASHKIDEMGVAIRDCIQDGIPHSLFRRDADKAIHQVDKAKEDAKAAIEDGNHLLDLLKTVRQVATQIDQMNSTSATLLEKVAYSNDARIRQRSAKSIESESNKVMTVAQAKVELSALSQKAQENSRAVKSISERSKKVKTSAVVDLLIDRDLAVHTTLSKVSEAVATLAKDISTVDSGTSTEEEEEEVDQTSQDRNVDLTLKESLDLRELSAPVERRPIEEGQDDVFGSIPLKENTEKLAEKSVNTFELREKLQQMLHQCSGEIVEEQTQVNGKMQLQTGLSLPTVEQAESIKQQWRETKALVDVVLGQSLSLQNCDSEHVRLTVQARDAKVRRFSDLAIFGFQQSITEEALSKFLNLLDRREEKELDEELEGNLQEIESMLNEANLVAEPVLTDVRVRHHLNQLRQSFQDMVAMKREAGLPSEEIRLDRSGLESIPPSPTSTTSSTLPSLTGSMASEDEASNDHHKYRAAAQLTTKPSIESLVDNHVFLVPPVPKASNYSRTKMQSSSNSNNNRSSSSSSSGGYVTAPQSTPGQRRNRRVVSDGTAIVTPSRLPLLATSKSQTEMTTPTRQKEKRATTATATIATATATQSSSSSSSHDQTSRIPMSSHWPPRRNRSDSGERKTSSRRTSSGDGGAAGTNTAGSYKDRKTSSDSSKPNSYRANPKSKLDVAVAKIVNKLPMPVQITHASVQETKAKKEQWQDESGRYWVGHPDPKLCFCRILRSRTVMVRIGGGWQELTTYILKHYSHLAAPGSPQPPPDDSSLSVSLAPSPCHSPQLNRGEKTAYNSTTTMLLATPTLKSNNFPTTADFSPDNSFYLTPVHGHNEGVVKRISPGSGGGGGGKARSKSPIAVFPPSSPILFHNRGREKSQERKQGLWLHRERKGSLADAGNNGTANHARSTLASRSRTVSQKGAGGGAAAAAAAAEPRRRVESMSSNHYDSASQNRSRANSRANLTAVEKRTPRVPLTPSLG